MVVWYLDDALIGRLPVYGPFSGNAYYFSNNAEFVIELADLKDMQSRFPGRIKVLNNDYQRISGAKQGTVQGNTRVYVFEGKSVNVLSEDVPTVIAFLES